jgi:hypothetical protein
MRSLSVRTNFDGATAESHICFLYDPLGQGSDEGATTEFRTPPKILEWELFEYCTT